jgi:hypothetical protein
MSEKSYWVYILQYRNWISIWLLSIFAALTKNHDVGTSPFEKSIPIVSVINHWFEKLGEFLIGTHHDTFQLVCLLICAIAFLFWMIASSAHSDKVNQ